MEQQDINSFIERNLKNFSVNSTGWNDLIGRMLSELLAAGWNMEHDVFGKEKFGGLRCYIYSEDEELNANLRKITNKYAQLSGKTCEICGNEGKLRIINSWETTLCINHFIDQKPIMEIDEEQNIMYKQKSILNMQDIVKAEVEFDWTKLKLYTQKSLNTDEYFSFSRQEPNYYLLLKAVPLHLFPEDMQRKISDLFQNLKDCEVCGHKALDHKSCLRCHHEPWGASKYHEEEYEEKADYIKECQMDIFIDEDGYEEYFKYDRSFEEIPGHQILFTPADLEEYKKLLF
ncbi:MULTISPECIES: hypothetical protein [unclassified Chryseobacterium]|uniref:hypothetical protein n=1 Tax=unclassified Chryseobacterium TaxID=2593645 RepID=UPI00100B1382|nr:MULTISPECIES: hypothetical protein [unclassified Chryseobacterium]RXM51028.1 hypothetical protein BOQ64_13100 [Chryseobacterium sp. CH25]RXM64639.1 hypothetical protein BOQ60_10485 [Chryseobacterium sp. CH1]